MSYRLYFITCLVVTVFTTSGVIAGNFSFSPISCEFSVEFPAKYKLKEISLGGKHGVIASLSLDTLNNLRAESWALSNHLPVEVYAQQLEDEIRERGVIVNNVMIDKNSKFGDQIILTGRMKLGGETFHVKTVSFIGIKTRLDLIIISDSMMTQAKAQVDFRNSVRRK